MCRMSLLVAKQGYSLDNSDIENQFKHVKRMALGNNTIPFKYGHFTDSTEYDLEAKLIHEDGFGYYFHSASGNVIKKYTEPVFSLNENNIINNIPYDVDTSFMHSRLATEGSKNISNVQPLNHGNIVGMHNGSVSGIAQGDESDSKYIMRVIDNYFNSNDSVNGLEQELIEHIVKPSESYSSMNLILHAKNTNKIFVLCSYDSAKVKSIQHAQYYKMMIAIDDSKIYVSSESDLGEVISSGKKTFTKNNTLYVIDVDTGEVKEYYMRDLEQAIAEKNSENLKEKDKVKNSRLEEQSARESEDGEEEADHNLEGNSFKEAA
ncbi:MAG: hypothetical protein ACFFG0_35195 [Candidatus Thorarchaeota archaeon]